MKNLKAIAIQMFSQVCEGWEVGYVKEYKPRHFLIIADGQSIKGQSFTMVLTKSGWELNAVEA